jgi:hypothetical protein
LITVPNLILTTAGGEEFNAMTTHAFGTPEAWPASAALGAANWVCLAATPTFAMMALITGVRGDGAHDLLCAAAPDASPLSSMVWMYILMSAFHSVPWLKMIAGRRSGVHRS